MILRIMFCFIPCVFVLSQTTDGGLVTELVGGLNSGSDGGLTGILNTKDPDINRNVTELITSKGYPVENYVVQTEDGYLMQIQRIPYGRKGAQADNKQVVFLKHGVEAASDCFVFNFPDQSLGFVLADAGYDVWMGNSRGNRYARENVKLSPNDSEFWDFSFQDIAEYDLPASIDYVLNKTGKQQLIFIGHSQGATEAFALLSESEEYNEKIQIFVALAATVFFGHVRGPPRYLTHLTEIGKIPVELLGNSEFAPSGSLINEIGKATCDLKIKELCSNIAFLFLGADIEHFNKSRIGVYIAHFPAGSSTKSFLHYGQLISSKKFTKYDHGVIGNLLRYGKLYSSPPEYDLSKITTPVAMFWANKDQLADPEDIAILRSKLKTLVLDYKIPRPSFEHVDFVATPDAPEQVYKKVLELLQNYK